MHARLTISIEDSVYQQLKAFVPAKQRSQFIEELLADALKKKKLAVREAEYEEMAKDPDFLAEQAFFMDFSGDVGDEPW